MRRAALALVPMASVVVGCAASGADPGDAETATATSAVVVIERSTDTAQGTRAEASARFVRVSASTSPTTALRGVGAGIDLPAAGACSPLASLPEASPSEPPPVAELLDVGTVALEANGLATRLLPRQLPDVTDVVSGVVYARAADATLLPPSAEYVVHVGGGAGFASTELSASAPADPSDVRLQGEETADAGGLVTGGANVVLEWNEDASGDQVYVDVAPSAVRCLMESGGHGIVPSAFLDDAGTLVLHRLHRESLRAGEIRFDFARTVAYAR